MIFTISPEKGTVSVIQRSYTVATLSFILQATVKGGAMKTFAFICVYIVVYVIIRTIIRAIWKK